MLTNNLALKTHLNKGSKALINTNQKSNNDSKTQCCRRKFNNEVLQQVAGTATCIHINRSSSSFWVWIQIVFFHSFLVKFVFNVSFIDFNDELSYFKGGLTWKSDVFEYICFACRFSNIHTLWVCGELNARRIVFFFNIFRQYYRHIRDSIVSSWQRLKVTSRSKKRSCTIS